VGIRQQIPSAGTCERLGEMRMLFDPFPRPEARKFSRPLKPPFAAERTRACGILPPAAPPIAARHKHRPSSKVMIFPPNPRIFTPSSDFSAKFEFHICLILQVVRYDPL
jgi:hypothetical protein